MKTQLDNTEVSKHLGQRSEYKTKYDHRLLVREPRQSNRAHLGINDDTSLFVGYDVWNAYEVSGLTINGVPVTGYAKIRYSCTNKYIVESKSLKLYFNSFNMSQLGENADKVRSAIEYFAERDLSRLLETSVEVTVFPCSQEQSIHELPRYRGSPDEHYFKKYVTLEDAIHINEIECSQYNEDPSLLEIESVWPEEDGSGTTQLYHSSLLKSNCRVTGQPDWGDVYILMKSHAIVNLTSLLKYIVSFRDECHFHEEICETIYKRLSDAFTPTDLCVSCLYVRRGGIDINPVRASRTPLITAGDIRHLVSIESPFIKTSRQ